MPKKQKDYSREAIRLHEKLRGKIEVQAKAKINNREDLSMYYTPGVGAVSRLIAKNPSRVWDLTAKHNLVAVVSDGSAVLGLGNIGPEAALPVMEGKAVLFKRFAGVDAVPIVLSVQDPDKIVEAVKAIAPGFGGINLEDIAAPKCFSIEETLSRELSIPVMHDDQHGTAIVVLAALINALKVAKKQMNRVKIVVSGAGAAGVSITKILLTYGAKNIIALDSVGAIYYGRAGLTKHKQELAKVTNLGCRFDSSLKCEIGNLSSVIRGADIFIGVSAPEILTADMVSHMNKKPIVFALSNPVPEIMPEAAKRGGAFITATGRSDFPNQINNTLAFPGVFRGALDHGVKKITMKMKVRAASNLANIIQEPRANYIIPSVFDKRVVPAVSRAIRER